MQPVDKDSIPAFTCKKSDENLMLENNNCQKDFKKLPQSNLLRQSSNEKISKVDVKALLEKDKYEKLT